MANVRRFVWTAGVAIAVSVSVVAADGGSDFALVDEHAPRFPAASDNYPAARANYPSAKPVRWGEAAGTSVRGYDFMKQGTGPVPDGHVPVQYLYEVGQRDGCDGNYLPYYLFQFEYFKNPLHDVHARYFQGESHQFSHRFMHLALLRLPGTPPTIGDGEQAMSISKTNSQPSDAIKAWVGVIGIRELANVREAAHSQARVKWKHDYEYDGCAAANAQKATSCGKRHCLDIDVESRAGATGAFGAPVRSHHEGD